MRGSAQTCAAIDAVCGTLIAHCRERGRRDHRAVRIRSGRTSPDPCTSIALLREAGLLAVRDELGHRRAGCRRERRLRRRGSSGGARLCARSARIAAVQALLERLPGVERVLDRREQAAIGLDHERVGRAGRDRRRRSRGSPTTTGSTIGARPTIARTVDIHRKPGYDPAELFVDPALPLPTVRSRRRSRRRRSASAT